MADPIFLTIAQTDTGPQTASYDIRVENTANDDWQVAYNWMDGEGNIIEQYFHVLGPGEVVHNVIIEEYDNQSTVDITRCAEIYDQAVVT